MASVLWTALFLCPVLLLTFLILYHFWVLASITEERVLLYLY